MGLVQKMVVLSPRELCAEPIEGSNFRSARPTAERIEDKVICPMPRRVVTVCFVAGDCAKPFWQQRRSATPSTLECEANLELLEIVRSKTSSVNPPNFGCSPPFFSGSPPCRAGNPIVRDVEFIHQRQTPFRGANTQANPSVQQDVDFTHRRLGPPSPAVTHLKPIASAPVYRASPQVRVEGFDCAGRGFECASRDTRRQVPAIA